MFYQFKKREEIIYLKMPFSDDEEWTENKNCPVQSVYVDTSIISSARNRMAFPYYIYQYLFILQGSVHSVNSEIYPQNAGVHFKLMTRIFLGTYKKGSHIRNTIIQEQSFKLGH